MTIYNKFNIVIMLLLSSLASPTSLAQITLDGTLGRSGALTGPDYQITADLGQQHGGNLFHSFNQFDIHPGESATFSGPNRINNIISRVTGGNPSHINGLLRSQIPDADLYLLNPAGIFFGQGAELDIQGSFHASTADTLRFEDGSEFNARQPQQSLLTVASPRAFGFLTDTPAQLTVEESTLAVPQGRTLSLIGGGLNMNNAWLESAFGRINLASLASSGEVIPTESDLHLSANVLRGSITANNTSLDVSGEGGGSVFIRGGRFELTDSVIAGQTLGDQDGEVINIQVDQLELQGSMLNSGTIGSGKAGAITIKVKEALILANASGIFSSSESKETKAGPAGNIEIQARQLTLKKGQIGSGTFGPGKGNSIVIVADVLTISGFISSSVGSGIFSSSESEEANAGPAGNIEIQARQLTLTEGGKIRSNTSRKEAEAGQAGNIEIQARQLTLTEGGGISSGGTGKGGYILIKVADTLTISGSVTLEDNSILNSGIGSSSGIMEANVGPAGNIEIQARQLTLTEGGQIFSGTRGSGKGGSLLIKVADALTISGSVKHENDTFASGIYSSSERMGSAGKLEIQARQLTLTEGGQIVSGTRGPGEGGSLVIKVTDILKIEDISGIYSSSVSMEKNAGPAGNIKIQARQLTIEEGMIDSGTIGPGGGGSLVIEAQQLTLTKGGQIISGTKSSGKGGSLLIKVDGALIISGSVMRENNISPTPSGIFSNSDSTEATGPAGNIEIQAGQLNLRERGVIASATEGSGKGGSIFIKVADTLTISGQRNEESFKSGISAGSQSPDNDAGNAGDIEVQAHTINLTDNGVITTQSDNASGGNIIVTTPNLVYLKNGGILTNVKSGKGNGGNITIDKPHLTVLNNSKIIAQADEGNGGDIDIQTDQYIKSADSVVSASSRLGIDGKVLETPNSNIGGQLVALPKVFLNPSLPEPCVTQLRNEEESSRFVQVNRVGKQRDELSGGVLGSYLDISTKR